MLTYDSVLNRKYPWVDYPLEYFDPGHCMAGWYPVMDNFLESIEKRCTEAGLPLGSPETFQILQLKEKWGELTIYCGGSVESFDLCMMAEVNSGSFCMFCGKPGRLRTGAWHATLCDDCQAERMRQYHASQ